MTFFDLRTINTREYENTHGVTPNGTGRWIFEIVEGDGSVIHYPVNNACRYTAARQAVATYVRNELNVDGISVSVLP